MCTLEADAAQLGEDRSLPALMIEDYPDFAQRGVMLDVGQDQVPRVDTLYKLIDMLASWKINQFQLYMEHTFAYQDHHEVWEDASPFTGQEILELDAYCRQRHIDLVPNQNSLGHMERWLKFDRYRDLSESPDGFPWREGANSFTMPASTLNPLDPRSLEFVGSLYRELLPHFTSHYFNAGGDEPWELGKGRSKQAVEERGGRVYLDYLLGLYRLVKAQHRQMMFWADIIVHHPDLIKELPPDLIPMIWDYEPDRPKESDVAMVAAAVSEFYVCPGTNTWRSIAGRTDAAISNQRTAAQLGMKYQAAGYLNTDWGDAGYWQPLVTSYLGFAHGAAQAWNHKGEFDLVRALDLFAFHDRAGVLGKLAYDLGNVYRITSPEINIQVLFNALQVPHTRLQAEISHLRERFPQIKLDAATLRKVIGRIAEISAPLAQADLRDEDAEQNRAEFRQAADLLNYSAKRLLSFLGEPVATPEQMRSEFDRLIAQQRKLWLGRHRLGGLKRLSAVYAVEFAYPRH
ncbi:MAG: family 20 glycosylhydrolase [Anaerolineae bacterium]